jgi:hypothetical protein
MPVDVWVDADGLIRREPVAVEEEYEASRRTARS